MLMAFTQRPDGQQLLENFDFENTRESWIMYMDFTNSPPSPMLPDGMQFITMADGATVEDIARLHTETFRDHRGSQEEPLEEVIARWHRIIEGVPDFDPALYAIVKDGDADVAIVTVDPTASDDLDKGVVSLLGVMPAYRRRNIGLQLLYFAFDALYKRGKKSCELSVDASSLTGAARVYERAGMHKVKTFYAYELVLNRTLQSGIRHSGRSQYLLPEPAHKIGCASCRIIPPPSVRFLWNLERGTGDRHHRG